MKKPKVKSVKKSVRDDIKAGLIKQLKTLTGKFGVSEKLDKEINKGAKKLAKKISKEINIQEPVIAKEAAPETKAIKAPEKIKTLAVKPEKVLAKPSGKKKAV
jgi:hypothetical protein